VLPAILATICAAAVLYFSLPLRLYSETGLIPGVINLLNLLIAFFIAALAAVATFDRPGLDDPLKGEPATMKRKKKSGVIVDHILTHRQFVCYLFGFLSFASVSLLIGLYGFRLVGPPQWLDGDLSISLVQAELHLKPVIKAVGIWIFFFVLSQIVITTLLGIYFLCDRLQFLDDQAD
jgi:hypothetical protein